VEDEKWSGDFQKKSVTLLFVLNLGAFYLCECSGLLLDKSAAKL